MSDNDIFTIFPFFIKYAIYAVIGNLQRCEVGSL